MSGWILLFAVLASAVLAALVLPALRRPRIGASGHRGNALDIHRNRLDQLARDREAGLIGAREAAGAEVEIKRAILAASREIERMENRDAERGSILGLGVSASLALATGIAVYAAVGSFGRGDLPLAARDGTPASVAPNLASDHQGSELRNAIASLERRLEQEPGNASNLHLLARSYSAVGAYERAAEAYRRLLALAPQNLDMRGDYAEALVRRDDGFVGAAAAEQFERVRTHAPKDPRARYYLALRDAQAGERRKAALGWAAILRDAPPDAPYRPAIVRVLDAVIEDAGLDRASLDLPETSGRTKPAVRRGPSEADIAAASQKPKDAQLEMIRGMVAQLEARLKTSPEDVEGWLRLARSRRVLGEREQAIAALQDGLEANPGSAQLRSALDAMGRTGRD